MGGSVYHCKQILFGAEQPETLQERADVKCQDEVFNQQSGIVVAVFERSI